MVRFSATETGTFESTLQDVLPADGTSVSVFVRGHASSKADSDVSIVGKDTAMALGTMPVMVRIRKKRQHADHRGAGSIRRGHGPAE